MQLSNFHLKTIQMELGLKNNIEIVRKEKSNSTIKNITFNTIKIISNDIPIYVRYNTFESEKEIKLNELMGIIKKYIEEVEDMSKRKFSKEQREYIIDSNLMIYGKEYERLEEHNPRLVWQIVDEKIDEICLKVGDNFKKIYGEYLQTFSMKELEEKMREG